MPRAGLTRDAVVDAALELVDEAGPDALKLAAVAQRRGVATPSLYAHVGSLAELRRLAATRVIEELTAAVRDATVGRSGEEAVAALVRAYRAYARSHPGRYALLPVQPARDPSWADAAAAFLDVCRKVVAGFGLTDAEAVHAIRRIRAASHGFVVLENAGGFGLPEDLEVSFAGLVDMVTASLRARAPEEPRAAGR